MENYRTSFGVALLAAALVAGAGCSSDNTPHATLVVNSLADTAQPSAGVTTLRSAIDQAGSGETITFDSSLNGQTILLTIVGEAHSTLKGEV